MATKNETPSQRKYPQRIRKKVKYWYDEAELSAGETPQSKKPAKRALKDDDSSYDEKENNDESDQDNEEEEEEEEANEEISEYEKLRLKNLEENRRIMMELGLLNPKIIKKEAEVRQKLKNKPVLRKKAEKLEPTKRSLRLLKKTPEGKDLPITFEDTPTTPAIEENTRIEEESLPMNDDGTITDFLDSLKLSLSEGTSSQSTVESTDSLIDDMRSLELAKLERVTKNRVQSMCVHPMESKLLVIVGSSIGELGLLDANKGEVVQFTPHVRAINCVSVNHHDHSELFTTSLDGTLRRANVATATIDLVYQTDVNSTRNHLTWHSQLDDPNTLLVAHGTGEVGVVDLRTQSSQRRFLCHPRSVRTVDVHPGQPNYFLTASGYGEAKIWDLRNSKKNVGCEDALSDVYLNKSGKGLTSAFFSPNGNKVVTTCNDDRIRVHDTSDITNPKELHSILHDNHTGRWLSVFKAVWHPQSSYLFFVGSMLHPRRIQMYNGSGRLVKDVMDEQLTTVVSVISLHPSLPIVVGGNSTGKAHIFTTPQYIGQFFD